MRAALPLTMSVSSYQDCLFNEATKPWPKEIRKIRPYACDKIWVGRPCLGDKRQKDCWLILCATPMCDSIVSSSVYLWDGGWMMSMHWSIAFIRTSRQSIFPYHDVCWHGYRQTRPETWLTVARTTTVCIKFCLLSGYCVLRSELVRLCA